MEVTHNFINSGSREKNEEQNKFSLKFVINQLPSHLIINKVMELTVHIYNITHNG